ncbi:hypothetical protein D3C81_2167840 [compost metagenome]
MQRLRLNEQPLFQAPGEVEDSHLIVTAEHDVLIEDLIAHTVALLHDCIAEQFVGL